MRAPEAGHDATWLDDLTTGSNEERRAWRRDRDAHCLVEPFLAPRNTTTRPGALDWRHA